MGELILGGSGRIFENFENTPERKKNEDEILVQQRNYDVWTILKLNKLRFKFNRALVVFVVQCVSNSVEKIRF